MPRLLTSPAQTESARQDGAELVRVLEIQWGGLIGTRYYSDVPLFADILTPLDPDPVLAEPRVLDWGTIDLQAEPGTVGGHGAVTLSLADPDHELDVLFKTKPGIQNRLVYIHLYYRGTTWPDDRVTLFGGIIGSPSKWDEKNGAWSLSLKGAETFFDRTIGQLLTRQAFPELQCSECEGDSFPIVYGDPVFRVPCCPIDRPGKGLIGYVVQPYDQYLYLAASALSYGFTLYATITIVVGYGNNSETFTGGFFDPTDLTKFTIYTRNSLQSTGVLSAVATDGGFEYGTVPEANFVNPTVSRGGYLIYFLLGYGAPDPVWTSTFITDWKDEGTSRAAFLKGGFALLAGGGEPYVVSAIPGTWVIWQAGVPVYEIGPWTYCVNFLPSHEIIRVEARTAVDTPSGDKQNEWSEYNGVYWSYNLDNRDWNDRLNRTPFQVGITTVTLTSSPTDLGFTDPKIYVTMRGCTEDNNWASPSMYNAGKIIRHLLITRELGDVHSQFIDETAFASAISQVNTYMAFALMAPKKLNELCGDLAFQGGLLYFWDQGKAVLQKLITTLLPENNALTITPSNYARQTLSWTEADISQLNTQTSAKFKLSIPSTEQHLFRKSAEAITAYGERQKELDLWAYQYPSSVALMTEFWLEFWLEQQRVVTFVTYLCGVHLRPGDTINLGIDDAKTGDPIYANQLARIKQVHHTLANPSNQQMERVTITADVKLFDWTIDASVPPNGACEAPVIGTTSTTAPPPTTTTTIAPTTTTTTTSTTTTEGPTTTLFPPTTTTTTTLAPTTTLGPDCFGSCSYEWDGVGWFSDDVCTGTSCDCSPPGRSGTFIGEVFVSYCALPPLTTTTTTTTTTTAPPCSGGSCAWEWNVAHVGDLPGSETWNPRPGSCSVPCNCSSPAGPGTYIGEMQYTDCYSGTTTTTTTAGCASHSCSWVWTNTGSFFTWMLPGSLCVTPCTCVTPTRAGAYEGEEYPSDCVTATTTAAPTTTTTSEPTTTTDGPTTTTTTAEPTTTTTTTTTTAAPCSLSMCGWLWTGQFPWTTNATCPGEGCQCYPPTFAGEFIGQAEYTYCMGPTTTTTTSTTPVPTTTTTTTTTVAPTTTTTTPVPTTTTTTTTAAPPPCGTCLCIWNAATLSWSQSTSDCTGPCGCIMPGTDGAFDGETRTTNCDSSALGACCFAAGCENWDYTTCKAVYPGSDSTWTPGVACIDSVTCP